MLPYETTRIIRMLLPIFPILGLAVGVGAQYGNLIGLSKFALIAGTIPVLVTLVFQILKSLRAGELGLDLIAMISMTGALVFGEYMAGAVVALMYSGGQYLEHAAEGRARREMTALLSRAPRKANRRNGNHIEEVSIEEIDMGDVLVVRRGDLVPVDGIIGDDIATLDESALTGEPLPVKRNRGETVLSGAANAGDLFEMTATTRAADSTYAGILRLVETAQRSKAPMARMADRYALLFLVVTIGLASLAWMLSGDPVRAVAVLVIATPCPLILAVPIAWTAGVSRVARLGLLVKGARVLEGLGTIRILVIDKTGTLTEGSPTLSGIDAAIPEAELLRLSASLDQASNHVAAKALVQAARARTMELSQPTNVAENPGEGVSGIVDGRNVAIGGIAYIADKLGIDIPHADRPGTMAAAVAIDGNFGGILLFSDRLRDGSGAVLRNFKEIGVNRIILATGDRQDVAKMISADLPLDEVRAELSPAQKIEIVNAEKRKQPVLMIGDGVNDAPALAAADIGLAMGVHGSAAATEAADAVLLVDRLDLVVQGIRISRRCRQIATQSVVAGMGLSTLGMLAAAFGYLTAVEGALLQQVIDVVVILNALRVLNIRTG